MCVNDIFNPAPVTEKETKEKKRKLEKDIENLAVKFIGDPTDRNFEILMRRVKWGLRSFMFTILQDDYAVDDCMSRTMECIYYKRDMFDVTKGKFSTWMYRIAKNNCLKYKENNVGDAVQGEVNIDFSDLYESYLEDEGSCDCMPHMDANFVDEFDILYKGGRYTTYCKEKIVNDIYDASVACMNKLPDNLRVVLKERYVNRKKVDDIAIDNKIPVSSVKNWLRSGVIALNEELKETVPELYEMYIQLKEI